MGIRLIKWTAFSLLFGLLPLGVKTGILFLYGESIGYSDIYAEIVFVDLALIIGMVSESISFEKQKIARSFLISFGVLSMIILVVLFTLLIMISYGYSVDLNYSKMIVPTIILSVASVLGGLSTQIMAEVER